MSSILYKDGEEVRVNATEVANLLEQGYTAEKDAKPAKKAPAKKTTKKAAAKKTTTDEPPQKDESGDESQGGDEGAGE